MDQVGQIVERKVTRALRQMNAVSIMLCVTTLSCGRIIQCLLHLVGAACAQRKTGEFC